MERRDFIRTTLLGAAALGVGFYGGRKIGIKHPFETIIKTESFTRVTAVR